MNITEEQVKFCIDVFRPAAKKMQEGMMKWLLPYQRFPLLTWELGGESSRMFAIKFLQHLRPRIVGDWTVFDELSNKAIMDSWCQTDIHVNGQFELAITESLDGDQTVCTFQLAERCTGTPALLGDIVQHAIHGTPIQKLPSLYDWLSDWAFGLKTDQQMIEAGFSELDMFCHHISKTDLMHAQLTVRKKKEWLNITDEVRQRVKKEIQARPPNYNSPFFIKESIPDEMRESVKLFKANFKSLRLPRPPQQANVPEKLFMWSMQYV